MRTSGLARVFKNTGALMTGLGFRLALSFVFVVIIARFSGVETFGKYELSLHYFDLFLSVSSTGLSLLITRDIAKKRNEASEILSAAFVLLLGLSVLSGGMLMLFTMLAGYAPDTQIAMLIVAIALIPASLGVLFESVFMAYERAEFVTIGTIIECVLRIGLSFVALALGYELFALMCSLLVARLCTTGVYLCLLRRVDPGLRWRFQSAQFSYLFEQGKVFTTGIWLSSIHSSMPVVALSLVSGEAAVGVFVAASKLLRLGTMAAVSFRTAVFPHLSQSFEQSRQKFRDLCVNILCFMMLLVVPGVMVISLFADHIIDLLFSDEYAASIPVLRVLIWVLLFNFLNPFLSFVLFAKEQQAVSLRIALYKVLFTFTLPLYLIVSYGAVGTAWATVVAEAFACALYSWFALGASDIVRALKGQWMAAAAAGLLGGLLWTFRDASLPLVVTVTGLFYVALLSAVGLYLWSHQRLPTAESSGATIDAPPLVEWHGAAIQENGRAPSPATIE